MHLLLMVLAIGFTFAKHCEELTINVELLAENFVFNLTAPTDSISTANFLLNFVRQGHVYTKELLSDPPTTTVTGPAMIAATFCCPDSGAVNPLLILTHGIGFNRAYWDITYGSPTHSFVNSAVDGRGYCTLAYDRPGTGGSYRGDPIQETQAALEVSALKALTVLARTPGGLPIAQPGVSWTTVIHVGHSYGSALSYTLTKDEPTLSDGMILTGFSHNASWLHETVLAGNWVPAISEQRTVDYGPGYLAMGSASAVQQWMFAEGQFQPDLLDAFYANIQPVAVGELLTGTAGSALPSTFAKPVLVVTGERDLPFCGGDCLATGGPPGTTVLDKSKTMMPNSPRVDVCIVPKAGHALNAEAQCGFTYNAICDFIDQYIKVPA